MACGGAVMADRNPPVGGLELEGRRSPPGSNRGSVGPGGVGAAIRCTPRAPPRTRATTFHAPSQPNSRRRAIAANPSRAHPRTGSVGRGGQAIVAGRRAGANGRSIAALLVALALGGCTREHDEGSAEAARAEAAGHPVPALALDYRPGEGPTEGGIARAQDALRQQPDSIDAHVALASLFVRRARDVSERVSGLRRRRDPIRPGPRRRPADHQPRRGPDDRRAPLRRRGRGRTGAGRAGLERPHRAPAPGRRPARAR